MRSQPHAEEFGKVVVECAGLGGWTFERLRSKRDSKANLSTVHIFNDREGGQERLARRGAGISASATVYHAGHCDADPVSLFALDDQATGVMGNDEGLV